MTNDSDGVVHLFDNQAAELSLARKIEARKRALVAAGADTTTKFIKAAFADVEHRALVLDRESTEDWCDELIPIKGKLGEPTLWRRPRGQAA